MTIILGILKLILIVLLVLLAVTCVILALILFAPVRYSLKGSFIKEVPDARAELRWLHGVLSAKAAYTGEHGLEAYVNVFGHKIYDILGGEDEEAAITEAEQALKGRDGKAADHGKDNDCLSRGSQSEQTDIQHQSAGRPAEDIKEKIDEQQLQHKGHNVEARDTRNDIKSEPDGDDVIFSKNKPKIIVYSTNPLARLCSLLRTYVFQKPGALLRKTADCISDMTDAAEARLKALFESLKATARAAKAAFTKRSTQLKALKALWDDKRFAACKALLLDRIVKLLLEIKPRSGSGYIRIGRDDPYSTGQVMQLAAFLYPFYADTIELIPDFDQSILEGELDIRGRIRLIIPAEAALRIFFNKELKLMYRKARHILELD